jgi:signal transduction histidine kinase
MHLRRITCAKLKILQNFSHFYFQLTGGSKAFGMEHRIFNGLVIILMAAQLVNIPFTLAVGLKLATLAWVISLFVLLGIYYLSRIKKRFKQAFIYFAITGHVILAMNYLTTSGSQGTTPFLLILFFLVLVSLSPFKLNLLWYLSHALLIGFLFYMELQYPYFIKENYENESIRLTDTYITILIALGLIMGVLFVIRKNYLALYRNDRRLSNQIKVQNDALSELSQLKTHLLSVITHDMRGPLTSIKGYYDEIFYAENALSEENHVQIHLRLSNMVSHTLDMLDTTLAWSKSEVTKSEVQLQFVIVNDVIINVLKIQERMAADKGIQIMFDNTISYTALSNEGVLNTALRNIVNNAVKYSRAGGGIKIDLKADDLYCHVHISDEGIGMDELQINQLFSIQTKSTQGTGDERGSGLGLMLCKKLLEENQGKLSVTSKPGKGSCFTVSLPAEIQHPTKDID